MWATWSPTHYCQNDNRMIIRKSENGYKIVTEEIRKALEYNKNLSEGQEPIKRTVFKISKNLFFCGTNQVRNIILAALKLKFWEAPFTIDTNWDKDRDDFRLVISYK